MIFFYLCDIVICRFYIFYAFVILNYRNLFHVFSVFVDFCLCLNEILVFFLGLFLTPALGGRFQLVKSSMCHYYITLCFQFCAAKLCKLSRLYVCGRWSVCNLRFLQKCQIVKSLILFGYYFDKTCKKKQTWFSDSCKTTLAVRVYLFSELCVRQSVRLTWCTYNIHIA